MYSFLSFVQIFLANGFYEKLGLPKLLLYALVAMNEDMQRGITVMPQDIILAKLTPPGVESSIMALSQTIIILN